MGKMTARQVAAELKKSARWHRDFGGELARQAYDKSADFVLEHLIETDEQRRERFERWYSENVSDGATNEFARTLMSDEYNDGDVNVAWLAFNAALTWHGETEGGE